MPTIDELFAGLRRRPDVEAPNLYAVDGADRLILDLAADVLNIVDGGEVAVIGDNYGALTLGAAAGHDLTGVRVHQDLLTGERALAANAEAARMTGCYLQSELGNELLDDASLVLLRLPRGLAELTETAEAIARNARSDVQVFAGGRDKHLTPAMTDVLEGCFGAVTASRGRQKSRVLLAKAPLADVASTYPVRTVLDDPALTVVAHGGAFAGAKLDIGTRFLLDFLPRMQPGAATAVDLGCGTGILATALALARPSLQVIATDRSRAAVRSAIGTAEANGVRERITGVLDDAMTSLPTASADLVVCNPPFHLGAAVHTGSAEKMLAAAGRVLRPGGELWTVHNRHLDYRGVLRRAVGPTNVEGRNAKFTVTHSVRTW